MLENVPYVATYVHLATQCWLVHNEYFQLTIPVSLHLIAIPTFLLNSIHLGT